MRRIVFLLVVLVCSAAAFGQDTTQGSLYAVGKQGKAIGACPLKTTSVHADISGFMARVRVRQEFVNSYSTPIEAVYTFPLSQNSAVDDMTMTVGERVIKGKIMRREEARVVYDNAKSEGRTAALLDEERANIFTQSVANIMPGQSIIVEIAYVETLVYDDGAYQFVFPMTIGPRYIPGGVKDAAKISPPTVRSRAGHDISIEVNLNAGVPIEGIRSSSHRIDQINYSPATARVTLRDEKTIPNKDFILRYDVTGKRIEDAILTHRDERGGFFTMILQPPDKIATEDRTPKEIVFVLDTSGSMDGFPIDKAKEALKLSLDGLYPDDTFNLITFAGDTDILFDKPVPATRANLERAQAFLAGREGSGGTEMMTAIKAALEPSDAADHLRIVCFMTDGEVGNDDEIVAEVQRHPRARVFSFGIGESVNRSLLDRIAQAGNGEATYVGLADDGSLAAKKFYERVRTPLLTDLSVDWNGMPVADIYPSKLSDLFSAKPVVIHARYTGAASGTIKLKGNVAGQPYERTIKVELPESEAANDVLATLWARTRIDEITTESLKTSNSVDEEAFDKQIADIGLEYRLLTKFTSFVAVEDRPVNQGGRSVTVQVPVEAPAGTAGTGDEADEEKIATTTATVSKGRGTASQNAVSKKWLNNNVGYITSNGGGGGVGTGRGSGNGIGGGSGSGTGSGKASGANYGVLAAEPPPVAPTVNAQRTPGSVVQESVTVTAGTNEVLQTEQSQISASIDTRRIENLPSNGVGGGVDTLTLLVPGVIATSTGSGLSVNGNRGRSNNFQINGSDGTDDGDEDLNSFSIKTVNGIVADGRVTRVVQPAYPSAARAAKSLGDVTVRITVDAAGNVVSAIAVAGPPMLRKAAERAATLSKFAPPVIDGHSVRLEGTIAYRFKSSKKVEIALGEIRPIPATEADKLALRVKEKMHFWLSAVIDRLRDGYARPDPNEAKFVHNGNADLLVDLTNGSVEVIEKLKQAGFVVVGETGKTRVSGHISLNKLAGLASIEEVKLILPKI